MLARLPSLTLIRLWAALLLAAIGLQAIVSAPALERQSGSAFSAATPDAALYVQRSERTHRQAVTPLPATPFAPAWEPALSPAPALAGLATLRPDSTGPPLRAAGFRDPAPRAPPRA